MVSFLYVGSAIIVQSIEIYFIIGGLIIFIEYVGTLAFDMDYAHWVDEHQRLLNDLRLAVNSQMSDDELHILVEGVIAHYNELFRLKRIGAKADIFHILYGMWKTPLERSFMWLGGFRSSELLKVIHQFSTFISFVLTFVEILFC